MLLYYNANVWLNVSWSFIYNHNQFTLIKQLLSYLVRKLSSRSFFFGHVINIKFQLPIMSSTIFLNSKKQKRSKQNNKQSQDEERATVYNTNMLH